MFSEKVGEAIVELKTVGDVWADVARQIAAAEAEARRAPINAGPLPPRAVGGPIRPGESAAFSEQDMTAAARRLGFPVGKLMSLIGARFADAGSAAGPDI